MVKKITFMTLISLLAIAPQAFAFSGGGGKGGNGPVSGTFGDPHVLGHLQRRRVLGDDPAGKRDVRCPTRHAGAIRGVSSLGSGLLGARYLRRR